MGERHKLKPCGQCVKRSQVRSKALKMPLRISDLPWGYGVRGVGHSSGLVIALKTQPQASTHV